MGGFSLPFAKGVNDAGMAVGGLFQLNFPTLPIIWECEEYEVLQIQHAVFYDVTNSGKAVGSVEVIYAWGFIWEDGG